MAERANYGERYVAHAKAAEAKRRMDDAIATLERAEREWFEACRECDRLDHPDDNPFP